MKTRYRLLFTILLLIFVGCASMNDSLTPNAKMIKSDFDNSIEISQDNVSAASSINEGWHVLGLFWTNRNKDSVILNVGRNGTTIIDGVAFNIDGEIISLKPIDVLTDYSFNPNMNWSYKRFQISMKNFLKLAKADTVKMKVEGVSTYTVSTFGKKHLGAVISNKFPNFLSLLEKNGVGIQ